MERLYISEDQINLIKTIIRNFYSFEMYLIVEILIIHSRLTEMELSELLKIETKIVNQHLMTLKKDKFIRESFSFNTMQKYFYCDFNMIIKITKYKLGIIRKKIKKEGY
jgi:transcription initiation factor IIE alpha subunit